MKFTHLHTHSHYSLLDGLPKIPELLDYVKELGMDSVALTDHGVLYGAVEFYKEAKARGIKPIIGCEIYMSFESRLQKRPNIDSRIYHMILLVRNKKGYENLVKLVTSAHLEGFYYKPRIDEEILEKYSEGLIGTSACLNGKIPKLLLANKLDDAEKLAKKYESWFGEGNFYLELQYHKNIPEQQILNKKLIELAKKTDIPLIATNDIHYLRPEDAEAQDILMLINTGADSNDPERLSLKADDFSMLSPEKMIENFKEVPEAIENTQKIVDSIDFEFELGKAQLPHFPVPGNKTPEAYLTELCEAGLQKKYGENVAPEIRDRMNYELSVINKTGFAGYILIVQDFTNWALRQRIRRNARGSAAGSLVCYLTDITSVDPIKYGLLFERFLNPERISMPDIDMDFTDRRRDEVLTYVAEKYGQDHVAQIITFGTMAARAVIRDVGRALGYVYGYCDTLAKMIPFGLDLNETLEKVSEVKNMYKTDLQAKRLIDLAKKLEGVARHASTHACGAVISAAPLTNLVPLQHPTADDKNIVTQYEMHAIEDLGLLKMDFLGLKNLTIIEDTLARIYVIRNEKIDIEKIPFDDPTTYKLLQKALTTSVFQLECLSGETKISTTTIKRLYERRDKKIIQSVYLDEGKVHKNEIIDVFKGKEKDIYALIAENGWYIKASKDHYFMTENGWKKLGDITTEEKVLMKLKADHFIYNECKNCSKQINGQKEGKSKFCYSCSAKFYSNPSKPKTREKIKEAQLRFYRGGGKTWNDGLTKETNEILKSNGEKISKALAGRSLEDKFGKARAEKMKKAISQRMIGRGNHMFGISSPHRKGGFRIDLNHYVRSAWEADFARILNLHKIPYQYEPKTFALIKSDGEIMNYTPDFYVESKNTFYEIKGWMHELDAEKIELFKRQYPQYNFVLISATKFAEFSLKYKKLIAWECPRIPVKQSFGFMRVKEIKYIGKEETYDIKMKAPGNNFVANGFLVHNSDGMKRYLKDLKPTEFEDIAAMVALYRPGPMQFIPDYIVRKHEKKKIEYIHPKLEPILKNTQGIMIYQEQLMQLARDIAGFTLGEADVLRKAVGKKIKELLDAQEKKFIDGCVKNGTPKKIAEELWQWIMPFAAYGFNRSHSVAYAAIAYQTAYLKAHYPVEFMASVLTSEKADVESIALLIEECKKMDIEVLPPNINESLKNFTVVPNQKKIRFGLLAIKNVGSNIIDAVVQERKTNGSFKSIGDFINRVQSKDLNKKSMEALIKAGAFDTFAERNQLLKNLEKFLEIARENQRNKNTNQIGLFANSSAAIHNEIKMEQATPAKLLEKLTWEKELLGLYVSSHPLNGFKKLFETKTTVVAKIDRSMVNKKVVLGGLINNVKKIITKNGKPMLFIKFEDLTAKTEIIVFPNLLDKNPVALQENKIVFFAGRVDDRNGELKIIADDVQEIIVPEES